MLRTKKTSFRPRSLSREEQLRCRAIIIRNRNPCSVESRNGDRLIVSNPMGSGTNQTFRIYYTSKRSHEEPHSFFLRFREVPRTIGRLIRQVIRPSEGPSTCDLPAGGSLLPYIKCFVSVSILDQSSFMEHASILADTTRAKRSRFRHGSDHGTTLPKRIARLCIWTTASSSNGEAIVSILPLPKGSISASRFPSRTQTGSSRFGSRSSWSTREYSQGVRFRSRMNLPSLSLTVPSRPQVLLRGERS